MKKFFKALSLVLALVLIIGTIPVSAALEFSLADDKDGKKIIYIGGSNGEDENGKKCSSKKYYDFTKHIVGFDADTMDLKLESADKSIATTKNASDRVYAKSIGTTEVKIGVYDKDDDRLLGTVKVKVQVKKNAEALNAYVLDPEGNPVVDINKKLAVGQAYTVVLTRKDADGVQIDTDNRLLTCDDANVVIESLNKYNTAYAVTFKKAGTYKLHAAAFQSKQYNKELLSKDIEVKAGYDAVAVKQSGLDTVDVTFDQVVAGLTGDSFKAYYLVGETKIYPSAADAKVNCNENVATVKFLTPFMGGTEYFVEYEGNVVDSFKAAAFTADSVVKIEIPEQTFEAGTSAELNYKLLDENGIDIKSLLGSTLNGVLSFELVNGDIDTYVYAAGSKATIYLGTAGKAYEVKATYTWINKDGKTLTAEGQGKVASVTPAVWEVGTVTGVVTAIDGPDYIKADNTLNGDAKNIVWTLDNATSGAALQIAVPYTKNGKTVYEGFGMDKEPAVYTGYAAKSADESIVMLASSAPSGQKWALTANKAGSTTIIIYGVDSNGKQTVIGAVPVTVNAKREAKSFIVTPNKNNLNEGYIYDTIEFTVVLKDQYDQEFKGDTAKLVKVEKASGDPVLSSYFSATTKTGEKYVLWGDDVTTEKQGTLNLKFSVDGTNLSQTVYINCGNEPEATTQMLKLSKNTLNTAIKGDTDYDYAAIYLEGRSKSGYTAPGEFIGFVEETPKTQPVATGSAAKFVYTVTKDGAVKKASELKNFFGFGFDAFTTDSTASGTAIKLDKGTYTITGYQITIANGYEVVSNIGVQTLTVEDNQIMPVVTKKANAEQLNALNDAEVASAFEVKFNGSTDGITCKFNYTVDGSNKTAYVASVDVTIINKIIGNFTINVPVDTLVKTK